MTHAQPRVTYVQLLKRNRRFRLIWSAATLSWMGDWFTTTALFSLMLEFTGAAQGVGLILVSRTLPQVLVAPIAGSIADRFPRQHVMRVCNLLLGLIVCGFTLIDSPSQLVWVYVLTVLQRLVTSALEPAEAAAIQAACAPHERMAANTLFNSTWAAMAGLGALVGGLSAALLGRRISFLADAATYVLAFLVLTRLPAQVAPAPGGAEPARRRFNLVAGYRDVVEGFRLVTRDGRVALALFAKAGWAVVGGGALTLYTVFGDRVFGTAGGAAFSIGALFAARGLGAFLGPPLARWLKGDGERWAQSAIGVSFGLVALGYGGLAVAPWLVLAMLALAVSHAAIATIFVFSGTLIGLWVEDRLRGRIYAADSALWNLTFALSAYACSLIYDSGVLGARSLMAVLAAVTCLPLACWIFISRRTARGMPAVGSA